jgi:hypothetical protein
MTYSNVTLNHYIRVMSHFSTSEIQQQKKVYIKYLLNATLNWAFSRSMFVCLHGKLFNIPMPAQYKLFSKYKRLATGL